MENDFVVAADFADGFDILNHADFVVCPHHRYQNGVGADGGFEGFQVNQAVGLHIEIGYFKAFSLELAHGVEHGFVLGFGRDQVLALALVEMRRAFDGEVVRLGGTAGEHDFFAVGIEQLGDFAAGVFHRFFGHPAEAVAVGGGVAELLGEVGNHFFGHAFVYRSGGGVVEVNRGVDGHGGVFPVGFV